ncbi:hypothetical protein SAMN05660653_03236 [Desulfonatronum thiosulfatophilum]|uniref:Uncharacterized protein n=1 Tax=Desulfonatronum thiosulfatophilum TaxID=617002 RepID=A0A1G6EWY5_9BACT|nr:hypothetical protein [Desulfonatronum thiosulfatophilum]SDB61792.1 hypothetical protein SAMN05660653_03236 [Desulfonatronum thiosulfatophilum]
MNRYRTLLFLIFLALVQTGCIQHVNQRVQQISPPFGLLPSHAAQLFQRWLGDEIFEIATMDDLKKIEEAFRMPPYDSKKWQTEDYQYIVRHWSAAFPNSTIATYILHVQTDNGSYWRPLRASKDQRFWRPLLLTAREIDAILTNDEWFVASDKAMNGYSEIKKPSSVPTTIPASIASTPKPGTNPASSKQGHSVSKPESMHSPTPKAVPKRDPAPDSLPTSEDVSEPETMTRENLFD